MVGLSVFTWPAMTVGEGPWQLVRMRLKRMKVSLLRYKVEPQKSPFFLGFLRDKQDSNLAQVESL